MAKDYSFDVVCRTDMQEVANAVNQASKEIGTRYDFKGSKSSVTLDDGHITLIGDEIPRSEEHTSELQSPS